MSTGKTVVVGVDGSTASMAALRVAVDEARRRAALLRVVSAYDLPVYWSLPASPVLAVSPQEIGEAVLRETRTVVDQYLAGVPDAPKYEVQAIAGPAGRVLVDEARDADLLVVGHRGRGGFSSMLLGSVGLACVIHAPCTVTVVRETRDLADDDVPLTRAAAPVGAP